MRRCLQIVGLTIGVIVAAGASGYLLRSHSLIPCRPHKADHRLASLKPDPRTARLSCGPAALMALAEAWDAQAAERLWELLERDRAATRPVTSLHDLAAWGRQAGLDLVGLKVEPRQLARLPLPAIVQMRPDHFVVVLETADDDRVVLTDQGNVKRGLSCGECERQFTGYALCLRS